LKIPLKALATAAVAALLAVGTLTGCTENGNVADPDAIKIALLLPDSKTARYEALDRPYFEDKLATLGNYEVLYSNADQDPSKQQSQAEAALVTGAKVLVLDPVDSAAAASIVSAANARNVPVIAYDRFIEGGGLAYYVSFQNEQVGIQQATALVNKMKKENATGGILMLNGSPTDANAAEYKSGAHSIIDPSGFEVLAEYSTPDWSPDKAQEWVASQITQFRGQISGMYAANDGTASGAIAAFSAANVSPIPWVTGQDADLAAIQRIVIGDQYMTIYKGVRVEAELAAEVTHKLVIGEKVVGQKIIEGAPSTLLPIVAVTVENILDTVVKDEVYTVDEICTPTYAEACAAAGLK
jgi:D-xylose transport system substrate-binding protein